MTGKAKAFAWVCLGLLALVATYHLGTRHAVAQEPAASVTDNPRVVTVGRTAVLTDDGTFWIVYIKHASEGMPKPLWVRRRLELPPGVSADEVAGLHTAVMGDWKSNAGVVLTTWDGRAWVWGIGEHSPQDEWVPVGRMPFDREGKP